MDLKQFLSSAGGINEGEMTDWMSHSMFELASNKLWAGDPAMANSDDGCVAEVDSGKIVVEAMGTSYDSENIIAKLRAYCSGAVNPARGEQIGGTGTDSGMIGFADAVLVDDTWENDLDNEFVDTMRDTVREIGDQRFGAIQWKKIVMPFVAVGDGFGPVFAVTDESGKLVGLELSFVEEDA